MQYFGGENKRVKCEINVAEHESPIPNSCLAAEHVYVTAMTTQCPQR